MRRTTCKCQPGAALPANLTCWQCPAAPPPLPALQASRILQYLGSHVMLLTSMNLWDYLLLKVELEGTSGEGSVQVGNRPIACPRQLAHG